MEQDESNKANMEESDQSDWIRNMTWFKHIYSQKSTYIHIYSTITIQHMKGSRKKPSDLYTSVSL